MCQDSALPTGRKAWSLALAFGVLVALWLAAGASPAATAAGGRRRSAFG